MDKENYKYIIATGVGAIGGLILGHYLWGSKGTDKPLSKHLSVISKVLKQIEEINTEEADELRERINEILKIIESNYGSSKGKNK